MTPHGARPLAAALVLLVLAAACQTTATPTPSAVLVPSPTATTASMVPSPSVSVSPSPESPSPVPATTPSAAPAAQAFSATGEAGDVLFAPDGRIVMVTRDFNADRSQVVSLDASGTVLDGWPWTAGDTGSPIATAALGPDRSVYVAVRSAGSESDFTWNLHRLDIVGNELAGFPVTLPPVVTCTISVAGDGAAFTACEQLDDTTNTSTTTLSAVRPDGSAPGGWPIILGGSATLDGFLPDGSVLVWDATPKGAKLLAIRPDGSTAPGWPRPAPDGGYAMVDGSGRVRITGRTWAEGQCGAATGTTYSILAADGAVLPGWPVHLKGWASDPLVGDDGSMTIVTDAGKALRYGLDGKATAGWTASNVDVAVGCYSGSSPVDAGGGDSAVVGGTVTLLGASGAPAEGWPAKLPYPAAIECPGCTPGPNAPLAPAIGADSVYLAAYGNDRPRVVTLSRDGALVAGGQRVVGETGEEIGWIRIAPAGRVWMLLTQHLDDATTSRLVQVGEGRALGG